MNCTTNLSKLFTVLLLAVALLISTAFSQVTPSALAGDTPATNEISNFKGDSSNVNRSYHALQEAAHDFRQNFRADITTGQRGPTKENDHPTNSPKQAIKNVGKKTQAAFGRTANSLKNTLDPG